MTFRFEEDDYEHTYRLEDFYFTNPFHEGENAILSLYDSEKNKRLSFMFNFNKTFSALPNTEPFSETDTAVVKSFVTDMQEELLILIKQRALEAKAYGQKNPKSYLSFESGRFINYMEMFPRDSKLLDFQFEDQKYFIEDSYELDPRVNNKSLQISFYKYDSKAEEQAPLFNYTYHFDEAKRAKIDEKLGEKESDMMISLNKFIPNLNQVLKTRYKDVKKLGKDLLDKTPKLEVETEVETPAGKKVKKSKKMLN